MNRNRVEITIASIAAICFALVTALPAQEIRLKVSPENVVNESEVGEPAGLVDEQDRIIGPPVGEPSSAWKISSTHWKKFPYSAYVDLKEEKNLASLWIFDTHSNGELVISVGKPGGWKELHTYGCGKYKKWVRLPMDATTRYVRLTRKTPGAQFTEIALYEYTAEAYKAMRARKTAEAKAKAEREAALARAREEIKKRPLVDVGSPFGKLHLVDEVDCSTVEPGRDFYESPEGFSQVQQILDRKCRVLKKTKGEAALFSYRIGKMKLLTPGAAYVLAIDYPEDAPRSIIVRSGGSEISRGFHTGRTFGDAFHPKYVNNVNESIDVPLSGKYETWKLYFNLHDRFPDRAFLSGDKERPLTPEDGFWVTIAQFSAKNIPASEGAAVSRIRLFAVTDPATLDAKIRFPPDGLPRRRLFWREEMADGVIGSVKNKKRAITKTIDWYRYKANTMKFLGMNTYTKDLLEFGACQHWNSTAGGGNNWVYFNSEHRGLWAQVVELMGEQGFDVFPYYEYSGSKGDRGLGQQRRARPLTRDDSYTHITWRDKYNADITDPDTFTDFQKMLDLTILRHQKKARFIGAWLRPRSQLPMGFGDATRGRFAKEANNGKPVTRKQLIADAALLRRYKVWWYGKRREFLVAMSEHLRKGGIKAPLLLFTAEPREAGVSFPTWEPRIVTDSPDYWKPVFARSEHQARNRSIVPLPLKNVLTQDLFLAALQAESLNWGKWEVNHSSPPSDPGRYRDTEGVLLSHCFNRTYTVGSPRTFDAFRGQNGLAIVRHHTLNENMLFDKFDKPKHGYFVVDMERSGPHCMLAETLAMANGDPTHIGYLSGGAFGRGFPEYARKFNTAFLSLPALPSKRLSGAASDPEVIVRAISTPKHGTYLAIANTGLKAKQDVSIALPAKGTITDAATTKPMVAIDGKLKLSFHACELRAVRIQ